MPASSSSPTTPACSRRCGSARRARATRARPARGPPGRRPQRRRDHAAGASRRRSGPVDSTFPGADLLLLLVGLGEPAAGHALGLGEEGDAVAAEHMQVTEEGVLVAREGEEGYRYRDAPTMPACVRLANSRA